MRPKPTHVYVVARGDFTKIGVSYRPDQRISSLPSPFQGMGRRTPPLRRIGIWYCADCALNVEGIIKREFAAHKVLGDEWFDIPPDEIMPSLQRLLRVVERILQRRAERHAA